MNMDKLMKQAQKMQAQIAAAQEELAAMTIEGASGGGMVRVTANGHGEILSIAISPEIVKADEVDMLEDMVLTAIKDAASKSKDIAATKMNSVTGGMGGIPGLM